jgi:putative acetyltransferase
VPWDEPEVAPTADDVAVFLVAYDAQDRAVACGSLRLLDDAVLRAGVAEIKRMYAVPAARGTGAAVAVLRALEEHAHAMGLEELVLETGTAQPDAHRFYEREGYLPIPLFGDYVGSEVSVCYARPCG